MKETKAFANLATSKKRKDQWAADQEIAAGLSMQEAILVALRTLSSMGIVKKRDDFTTAMKSAFRQADVRVPAVLFKAILQALSERDETAEVCTDTRGNPEPDSELRDYENVPLKEDIHTYFDREVRPHVADAWIDESKTKVGYEINFNRYFYEYEPPRPLDEINAEIKVLDGEIMTMLNEITNE